VAATELQGAERANAKLVRKAFGSYLHITCYTEKKKREQTGKSVGLDFGIKDTIIDSKENRQLSVAALHLYTGHFPKQSG
jgi:transposase